MRKGKMRSTKKKKNKKKKIMIVTSLRRRASLRLGVFRGGERRGDKRGEDRDVVVVVVGVSTAVTWFFPKQQVPSN